LKKTPDGRFGRTAKDDAIRITMRGAPKCVEL